MIRAAIRRFSTTKAVFATPPALEETLTRFLRTTQPLLSGAQFEGTVAKVEAFGASTTGADLQSRLVKKDVFPLPQDVQGRSLQARSPLCIRSNWWFLLNDHPAHPPTLIAKPPPNDVLSSFQIERASGLIHNMLQFKDHIQDNSTSATYQNLFGSARTPADSVDVITGPDSESKHIVVMTKDQIYKLVVVDQSGKKASLKEIQRLLFAIGADSLETDAQPSVGLLTSTNRSDWAKNSSKLVSLSSENERNISTISSALFVLCLDDHSTIANPTYSHIQFMHNTNGKNRWFDKPVQLILASSGRAGINAEVSTVDAGVYAKLSEFLVEREPVVEKADDVPAELFPMPVKLKWVVDEEIQKEIAQAQVKVESLAKSTESVLMKTDIFGERYISEVARTDPDAFMQLALQVTWQRLHKFAANTSLTIPSPESGTLVSGLNLSKESWEFVESFDNDDILYDDKRVQFRAAIESLLEASSDLTNTPQRHLSALYSVAETDAEKQELESVFGDYLTSLSAKKLGLDTTNIGLTLPAGSDSGKFYAGFAQSWAHGYGIAYSIGKDEIKFSVSTKKGGKTNAYRFADTLKRTFADLMFLFPKRSEVWGYDWKEKFAKKKKEEYYLKTMKKLSDGYLAQKDSLAKKYAGQMKK